jgi:hypothetical protein
MKVRISFILLARTLDINLYNTLQIGIGLSSFILYGLSHLGIRTAKVLDRVTGNSFLINQLQQALHISEPTKDQKF